jgi:hypothetical protein
MSVVQQALEPDGDKLMQFGFRAVDEVGATRRAAETPFDLVIEVRP